MTAQQYQRIESLLGQAESVTLEHSLLTPQGRKIQGALREILVLVVAEKYRAEQRDNIKPELGHILTP